MPKIYGYLDVAGKQISGKNEWKVVKAVACPESYCRSAIGYCCTTKNGKDSSTCHASRWKAYRAAQNATIL